MERQAAGDCMWTASPIPGMKAWSHPQNTPLVQMCKPADSCCRLASTQAGLQRDSWAAASHMHGCRLLAEEHGASPRLKAASGSACSSHLCMWALIHPAVRLSLHACGELAPWRYMQAAWPAHLQGSHKSRRESVPHRVRRWEIPSMPCTQRGAACHAIRTIRRRSEAQLSGRMLCAGEQSRQQRSMRAAQAAEPCRAK